MRLCFQAVSGDGWDSAQVHIGMYGWGGGTTQTTVGLSLKSTVLIPDALP